VFRFLYAKLALELFLAELVGGSNVSPQQLFLVATYPLAFGEDDRELHQKMLEEVKDEIRATTGFQIILGPPLDESHAGEYSGYGNKNGHTTFYLDLGGATTDVCVSVRKEGLGLRDIRAIDSIELGGEDINGIVRDRNLSGLTLIELAGRIRRDGARAYLDVQNFHDDLKDLNKAKDIIRYLLAGMVEIGARFAAAESSANRVSEPLHIVMYGCGWMSLFPGADRIDIESSYLVLLKNRLTEYVKRGLIVEIPNLTSEYPENPKLVVAKGAASCSDTELKEAAAERQTYLLEDLEVVAGGRTTSLEWTIQTPFALSEAINRIHVTNSARFGFEADQVPEGNVGRKLQ
jgi:hypothetical protein